MATLGSGPLRKRVVRYILLFATIAGFVFYLGFPKSTKQHEIFVDRNKGSQSKSTSTPTKALVVARTKEEDTSWYYHFFPDWQKHVYVMDDPDANLTVIKNKGRESAAYLSFIIDNYDDLPDYMLFLHAIRYQWHNEDPMYDGVPPIQNLQLPYVDEEGYVNMRCTWKLGCPNEIHPAGFSPKNDGVPEVNKAFPEILNILLPGVEVPPAVGVQCGAQFALSKKKVLENPLSDYLKIRTWLWQTDLPDRTSGRLLEYMWHMIFGKPAVHCPHAGECFCKKFGFCNLTCTEEECEKRFQLPKFATIPIGWPEVGPGENGFPAKDWWL